jgi:tRNA(Ile)-lysidine synthase
MREIPLTPDFIIAKEKSVACLDANKLSRPLTIRRWRKGDFFVPFGMKGRKLVSDYLTDRKYSLPQKENQWVLCAGDDIVWLINERTDNRFRVDEGTKRVLWVEYLPEE